MPQTAASALQRALLLVSPILLGLCGCAEYAAPASSPVDVSSGALRGRVRGGQQAVSGANVVLYAAGSGGNGQGALNLLQHPVSTAADGSFSLASDFSCPSVDTQVYIVVTGGNPGLSGSINNSALQMVAALGDCSLITAGTFVYVDEVTTVAAAWALAPFFGSNGSIGASATNSTGLRNACLVANNLVNTTSGTSPGLALPAGSSFESAKLLTLANVLSPCVNSDGTTGCEPLLVAATMNGVRPATTLDAALAVVRNPATNVSGIFAASPTSAPFSPALTRAPNDWTMSLTYTRGGLSSPTALALDSTGSVWVANYSTVVGGVATKLSPTGVPASASGFFDAAIYESYGIAVDAYDNAWVTNEQSHSIYNGGAGTLSKFDSSGRVLSGTGFTAGGIFFPFAIAGDSNGDMWVADYGQSRASLLNNQGATLAGGGYSSGSLLLPVRVALDGTHDGWFAAQGYAVEVTPAGTIQQFACCREATGIALDKGGAVWVTDYLASSLVQLSPGGTIWQTLSGVGGLFYPESVATDGAGTAWVANYYGNSVSAVGSATGGNPSSVLSPGGGFGLDAGLTNPYGIALDASGNVWIANFGGNSVTVLVGLASPVKTPLLGLPASP